MRAKIRFPNRKKLIEREVRVNLFGIHYIISRGHNVEVVPTGDGVFEIAADWRKLYEKGAEQ